MSDPYYCFVRFHNLNPKGSSFNYRDGIWLPGNSVYVAECWNSFVYYISLPNTRSAPNSLITIMSNILLHDQPVFEVTGHILSELGSDGEPLLINVQVVRELQIRNGVICRKIIKK